MNKDQKPLRGIRDELFDVDWSHENTQRVMATYLDFWAKLDEETRLELDTMLM